MCGVRPDAAQLWVGGFTGAGAGAGFAATAAGFAATAAGLGAAGLPEAAAARAALPSGEFMALRYA
jgi:hypothetical protein